MEPFKISRPQSGKMPCCGLCYAKAYFGAYIKYGLIADESVNIQAGYAHKTFGFGGISVSIGIDGSPSFSAGVSTVSKYIARAVTVN